MAEPQERMETETLCLVSTWSMRSFTVQGPLTSTWSHAVNCCSFLAGGNGSDMANTGRARLRKLFRCASSPLPCSSLYSSRHTRPVTVAVVVAIAGIILPAMRLAVCLSVCVAPPRRDYVRRGRRVGIAAGAHGTSSMR